jgi:RHS repeat-associated protein
VFFDGDRVARKDFPSGNIEYYFSDNLKTASVITDATGNIKSESDYYPWGGELQFANGDSNHYKFTGKERDSETGLDYFGARYYGNSLGRFITPDWAAKATDVPYADFADPQSLNLYTYVRNIPTTKADADGHAPPYPNSELNDLNLELHRKIHIFVQQRLDEDIKSIGSAINKEIGNSLEELRALGNSLFGCEDCPPADTAEPANPKEKKFMSAVGLGLLLIPGEGEEKAALEAHHLLPREFKASFEALGFDIEKFTINVEKSEHRLKPKGFHTRGGGNWNKQWRTFFKDVENHKPERVLDQLFQMLRDFNIRGAL